MIIITGASRGLGNAIAKRLLDQNEEVLGLARNVEKLNFPSFSCDVSCYDQVKKLYLHVKKEKKSVKAVINAAGVASMNLAVTTPESVSQKIVQTNLLGTIYCSQLLAPLMIREKQGSIINFSTIAVALGLKGESVYAASKAGVEVFSRAFAREMADFDINVNCISPGPVDTDLIKGITSKQIDNIVSQQIINKQFKPDDICDLVELLLDKKSRSLSGQVLHVGGV